MALSCVIPASLGKTCYRAMINSSEHCYEVIVLLPATKVLKDARVECDWRLRNLLGGQQDMLLQYLSESEGVPDFLSKLKGLVACLETSIDTSFLSLPLPVCRQLAQELDLVGWSKVYNVDTLFRHIKLSVRDKKDREHIMTVVPTTEFPKKPPTVLVDAPLTFDPHWSSSSGLKDLLSEFEVWLDHLDPFWSFLEELDAQTWVLEPEKPTRADTHRRIKIGTHLSLLLHLDPLNPLCLPEQLQFLGPDQEISAMKDKVWKNSDKWDANSSLLMNLQTILDVEFPRPTEREVQEMSVDCACGICYDYRLEGAVPSVVCPNSHCTKYFHRECFNEWLSGLPGDNGLNSRTTMTGECPFCGQVITVNRLHV